MFHAVVPSRRVRAVCLAALWTGLLSASLLRAEEIKYREANVRAMWIKLAPEPVGGTSPFSVRVSENKTGDAAVGLIEHILGGAGDSWKSSAWIAAVAASNTKYTLLTDHEFLIKVRGFLDGPSAGMLMAATMIALMGQDEIRPHVTITGTVNPDGTIGPVSGIAEKMEGAKRAGIKEIGYPMIDDGDPAAFVAEMDKLGAQYGIRTVPVSDIYEAYKLLTGRTLGRTPGQRVDPLKPEEMEFSKEQASRISAAAQTLLTESRSRLAAVRTAQGKIAKASASLKKAFAEDIQRTEGFIAEAEKFASTGAAMMAHSRAVMADQSARMAEQFAIWQPPLLKNDDKTLVGIYDAQFAAAEKQLAAFTSALSGAGTAPTLAGRISGFHGLLQSWVVRSLLLAATSGKSHLEEQKFALQNASRNKASQAELKQRSDDIAATMLDTVLKLAILEGRVRALMDMAAFPIEDNNTPAPDLTALNKRLAESYGPAAAAGLAYFESTVIGLRSRGSSSDALIRRGAILAKDINYASCAEAATRAVRSGEDDSEELPGAVLDRLACGAHAWLGMASLMNKYYNLAEDNHSSDPVTHATTVTLRKGETVTRMLDGSRKRVLEEGAIVKKQLGFIPDSIKMNFNLAETKRNDAGDQAKLDALTSYWRAHFLCRMAHLMGRTK
jgi:uncharacterized protein